MKSKTFLDFLPTNFRHEKSFFIQNNLTDVEKISEGVSKPLVIGEVQKNVKMN